ncbi:RNA-binding protein [Rhodanobacter sp. FW510-R12]|uniref:RNA-binding S4 domain-containing protein n=1 Tax=unclassified Rhodanobacter TaxID=2621553 RepID=UPI0007A9A418|nr:MULTISPECIES: RNA-binding S4 domain-containing protein [unclassified Rhodanobacter]KZC18239.1 RNA-binding protein [Rhodanobacter sp. FW104-R8]KZC25758.1 RNA-binding protein [Rhodanobacter sp. FW510-T8]KZC32947.1 RNA-binding protein [Rhodanobacter sp. FW510-R10]
MSKPPAPATTDTRADVWLWAARFFRTRSLAKQAIDGGRIDVNDAGCKPAKTLRVGDRLKIGCGEERLEVEVLALSDRRGPAGAAQALYRETAASRLAREVAREQHRLVGASGPVKRPDKQARRELRRLKDTR